MSNPISKRFTRTQIVAAKEASGLSWRELRDFWRHYTKGNGKGTYSLPIDCSLLDFVVISKEQDDYERAMGI